MAKSFAVSLLNICDTLAISFPTVADSALGRLTREACDARLARWSRRVLSRAEIDLEIRGGENYDPSHTSIAMSNHQSIYDIPVLLAVLGANLRMVAKTELFRTPVWGTAMRKAGFVEIDRSNRDRAIQSLALAKQSLASGVTVWLAPEGTRSKTGTLLPFKAGGFHLAEQTNLPILPITIDGTREVLPPGHVRTRLGVRVTVTLAPPIVPGTYRSSDKERRSELMSAVRSAIEEGFNPRR